MGIENNVFFDTDISFDTPAPPAKTTPDSATDPIVPANPGRPIVLPNGEEHELIELALSTVTPDDDDAPEPVKPTKEIEKTDGQGDPPSSDSNSSSSPYSVFANALFEEGVITQFDQTAFDTMCNDPEIGPALALIQLNKTAIDDGIEAYKNSLNPYQKSLVEAFENGVPADTAYNNQVRKATFASITAEDLDDETVAEQVFTDSLRLKQFTDEEIEETVKEEKDLGRIVAKAKKALPGLVKYEADRETALAAAAKTAKTDRETAYATTLKTLQTTIDATTEIIQGVKITPADKKKMYAMLAEPVQQDPTTGVWLNAVMAKRAKNPVDFDIKLAAMINSGLFDGDAAKVVKASKTKAVQELSRTFENGNEFSSGIPGRTQATAKQTDYLDAMKTAFKK